MGSNVRLFEIAKNEDMGSPTSCDEAWTPHCKSFNPVMGFTKVAARGRVCTYGLHVAIDRCMYTISMPCAMECPRENAPADGVGYCCLLVVYRA